ncbi:MAG: isopentenyl transferase family protein, partial [Flavobacteriaceae bacterium]
MSANNLIISIEGPTASGNTALAAALAQHLETEIVSSDSRQCYKEMNIGTAVPTLDERKGIVHHMIHSHSVTDKLTAASFATCAQRHIEAVLQERDSVVLVGGSPLYAEAILYGLNELPEI